MFGHRLPPISKPRDEVILFKMACGVAESHGVIAGRSKAIEVYHLLGIRHERIRRDERTQRGVVIAGVVVHQPRGVAFLSGEGAVGLEVARRGALGAVGVVCTAGGRGRPACCQRGAAEMVAVLLPSSASSATWNLSAAVCRRRFLTMILSLHLLGDLLHYTP